MKNIILVIIFVFVLTACENAGTEEYTENLQIIAQSLRAEDIRADVLKAIIKRYPDDSHLQKAAVQMARQYQRMLGAGQGSDVQVAVDIANDSIEATACLRQVMDAYIQEKSVLKSLVFNTPERVRDYIRYDALLGGQVFDSYSGDAPCK